MQFHNVWFLFVLKRQNSARTALTGNSTSKSSSFRHQIKISAIFHLSLLLKFPNSIDLAFVTNVSRVEEWIVAFPVSQFSACHKKWTNENAKQHGTGGSQSWEYGSFHASFGWIFSWKNQFVETLSVHSKLKRFTWCQFISDTRFIFILQHTNRLE